MQASSSTRHARTELADQLLALWKYVAREAGGEFADLLEELDLSIAQVKTLDALAAHTDARRR